MSVYDNIKKKVFQYFSLHKLLQSILEDT